MFEHLPAGYKSKFEVPTCEVNFTMKMRDRIAALEKELEATQKVAYTLANRASFASMTLARLNVRARDGVCDLDITLLTEAIEAAKAVLNG